MKHQALVFTGLIGVGVALGATLVNTTDSDHADKNSSAQHSTTAALKARPAQEQGETSDNSAQVVNISETLIQLQEKLQQEIQVRKQLEMKVASLEKQFKDSLSSDGSAQEDAQSNNQQSMQNPHQAGAGRQGFTGQNYDWFNEQAMLDAGIDPTKVNFIKESFEQAEMDKLYLRNQAQREGWLDSKRYTDAAKEIADRTNALRDQLGEEEFDAYLFAAGRANRVIVASVLSSSPAGTAGIQAGDTILRYGNKRVYNWSDLTSATSEGTPNETVAVTIQRNGQTQQFYVPRGPLGVRLSTDSVAP